MPHFEYRVVKTLIDNKYPAYIIAEVYFDKDEIVSYSTVNKICSFPNPNLNISDQDAYSDLKETVKDLLLAFVRPLIDGETLTSYSLLHAESNERKQNTTKNISASE